MPYILLNSTKFQKVTWAHNPKKHKLMKAVGTTPHWTVYTRESSKDTRIIPTKFPSGSHQVPPSSQCVPQLVLHSTSLPLLGTSSLYSILKKIEFKLEISFFWGGFGPFVKRKKIKEWGLSKRNGALRPP